MSIEANKTKPQSAILWTVREVYIVPGTNEVTVVATSSDGEVKKIHETIDIQAKIDAVNVTIYNSINNFFNGIVADVIGVGDSEVVGELFLKSSGA